MSDNEAATTQRLRNPLELINMASTFKNQIGPALQDHFVKRKLDLERLAAGAAFEQWFSFEARLALQADRARLGLSDERYWFANEYRKIDLYIGDRVQGDRCHAAIEFKLIYNNKNWMTQCDRIWGDLYPARGKKAQVVAEASHLISVAVVVGKTYPEEVNYPSRERDISAWRQKMEDYLLPKGGWRGDTVERGWRSTERFLPEAPPCLANDSRFVELWVLHRG